MNKQTLRNEQGQSLVLIAFAVIGLVAFVALAVDGGYAFAQRREAQNGADAAAVAGTYKLYTQNRLTNTKNATEILVEVNKAAEAHNVPDSDGVRGNSLNSNVLAYYTDTEGKVLKSATGTDCQIGTALCSATELKEAWGVRVIARKPFTTFFAGMIGWQTMTVGANATGVTHVGPSRNNAYYALYGDNRNQCGQQGQGFDAVSASGASSLFNGQVYSASGASFTGSGQTVKGDIVYQLGKQCNGCVGAATGYQVEAVDTSASSQLTYPSFTDIENLIKTKAIAAGQNYGSITVNNNQTAVLGSVLNPYVYIDGDLNIKNGAVVTAYGAIFVKGSVTVAAPILVLEGPLYTDSKICAAKFNVLRRFSIFSTGVQKFATGPDPMYAKIGGVDPIVGPFVAPKTDAAAEVLHYNTASLYSNYNGGCNKDSVELSGANTHIYGSVLAPTGGVKVSGSNNIVDGAIIANSMNIQGASFTVQYDGACFPPQPDWIELIQ